MPNNAFKTNITNLSVSVIRRLRVLLASRKLFRNWLSAGIKYYLSHFFTLIILKLFERMGSEA